VGVEAVELVALSRRIGENGYIDREIETFAPARS
jgi:hypothetical protein